MRPFRFCRLEADTELKSFKSIDDDLNDFLLSDAKNYAEELLAVTYLMIDAETDDIIAYYSLLNDQIRFTEENKSVRNRINRQIPFSKQRTHYPAVKIGRLAVAEAYAHQGVGQAILESIKYKFSHGNRTGCRFITLDAYAHAVEFYEKCGFRLFTEKDAGEETRLMYFDLKTFK